MHKTLTIIIAVAVIAAAALLVLRFGFGGGEDTWLCTDGQWVPHGNPSAPKPTTGCGQANTNRTATTNVGIATPYDPMTLANFAYDPATPVIGRYAVDRVTAVALIDTYAYIVDDNAGFRILDVSDPALPTPVGYVSVGSSVSSFVLFGDRAYVGVGGIPYPASVRIYDITDRVHPKELGYYTNDNFGALNVLPQYVRGTTLYVLDSGTTLRTFDVSDPSSPKPLDSYQHPDGSTDMRQMVFVGDYAYIASGYPGVLIFNIADSAHPQYVGSYDTGGFPEGIVARGITLYIADAEGRGLTILDAAQPDKPVLIAAQYDADTLDAGAQSGTLVGDVMYMRTNDGVGSYTVANNTIAKRDQGYGFTGDTRAMAVRDGYVYLANSQNGLIVLQY